MALYRDELLKCGLSPTSVNSHLSTIRGRYQERLLSSEGRDYFYSKLSAGIFPAEAKALIDEQIMRLQFAIDPKRTNAKGITRQDIADSEQGLRLTSEQASVLLRLPNVNTVQGLRDCALITVALCAGLRKMELCGLDVDDLRQCLNGELAIRVREGKGKKQRLVPYGAMSWCLVIVDSWLNIGGITDGAVFRSIWKGGRVRDPRLSVRAVEDIVKAYPVAIDGVLTTVAPHDLRHTYARRLYEAGMGILEIQRNLGHSDHKITERYIGVGKATSEPSNRSINLICRDCRKINGVNTGMKTKY